VIVKVENEPFRELIDRDHDYAHDHACNWDHVDDVRAYQILINDFVKNN